MRLSKTYTYLVLILCFSLLIFSGCTRATSIQEYNSINDLMRNKENDVNIVTIENLENQIEITEKDSIEEIIETIRDIQIEELTKEEEIKLLDSGNRFKENKHYLFTLFHDRDVVIVLSLFSDGDLIVFDVMMKKQAERTKSYSATGVNDNDIKRLFDIIDKYRK